MSYLDFPRIHFAGQFETGPSTINNTSSNYVPGAVINEGNAGWNPTGNAYFQLKGCTVTGVVKGPGGLVTSGLDAVPVVSTDNWGGGGVPAKIVDLDPEQQMVSMLFGLQLKFGQGDDCVTGDMEPMWFQNYFGATATYQSVLRNLDWGASLTGALATLHGRSPRLLSIKFFLGPGGPTQMGPMTSTIVGTIGPANESAPINFVPARLLRPSPRPGNRNFGPAQVLTDRGGTPRLLTVDLGASVPSSGQTLTVLANKAKHGPVTLGTIDYSPTTRTNQALIFDLDLSPLEPADAQLVLSAPIMIVDANDNTLFEEDPSGIYVDASPYVLRMEANSTATVQLWARRFGAPVDIPIAISDESTKVLPLGSPPPNPSVGRVGLAGTPLSFPSQVRTKDGQASATLCAGNPDGFRKYIDGQVYALRFLPAVGTSTADPNSFLSLLVHDPFTASPTWANIEPIMSQYATLYPIMKRMGIDLGDEQSLINHKQALLQVFAYPIEDPRYMPVVRDLSVAKRDAIVAWLTAQPDPAPT